MWQIQASIAPAAHPSQPGPNRPTHTVLIERTDVTVADCSQTGIDYTTVAVAGRPARLVADCSQLGIDYIFDFWSFAMFLLRIARRLGSITVKIITYIFKP
jgi:hypothetical protein